MYGIKLILLVRIISNSGIDHIALQCIEKSESRRAEKVLDKIQFLSRNQRWMLPNLLIVDDEKNARDALEQLLNTEYEVFLAKNFPTLTINVGTI